MSVENQQDCQTYRVVASGTKPNLWPAARDTPQGLLLDTILFRLLIDNLDKGMGCLLSKLVDDAKLDRETHILEGKALIQRKFNSLETRAGGNFPMLNRVSRTG